MAQDRVVHLTVPAGRTFARHRDRRQVGAGRHPPLGDRDTGLRRVPAPTTDQTGEGAQRALHLQFQDLGRRPATGPGPQTLVLQALGEHGQVGAQGLGGAAVGVGAEEHSGDVHPDLGLHHQVIGGQGGGNVAAVVEAVTVRAGAQHPSGPPTRGGLGLDVQRRLVGEQMLVDRRVECDDQQLVVQRGVEQFEEVGELLLVLVENRERQRPEPSPLALQHTVGRRSGPHRFRPVPLGQQDVDGVLDQPFRLVCPIQEPVQVRPGNDRGQAVQDAAQQPEQPGGDHPAGLELGESGQALTPGGAHLDRSGALPVDARDRDPRSGPLARRAAMGWRCAAHGTGHRPAAGPGPASADSRRPR